MGWITTQIEESVDVQKVKTTTTTKQAVGDLEPPVTDNLRTYRIEQSDAVWTVVEEVLDKEQQVYQGQVDGTVFNDPLETHALFKDVPATVKSNWLKWKSAQPTDPVNWDPKKETDEKFSKFYTKYSKGFETFYAPRIIIRITGLEDGPPDQRNLGKIETPKLTVNSVPAGVTFVLSASRGNMEGSLWRNTYEWLGSAVSGTGWNTEIYSP